jgi:cytochrome b involved in lipid metabolism
MISIFGAGIAGLTCALELVEKGFNVTIYEKDTVAGGMAKSKRVNGIPTEHSWRGYANFYFNIFNLLKRIPIKSENFTTDEITKHNNKDDAWVTFRNNVYNITDFIKDHPGGSIIFKSLGKDLEDVWSENNVLWHINNPHVIKTLNKYKIGTIKEHFSQLTTYDNLYPKLNMNLFNNNKIKKEIVYYDLINLFYHFIIFSSSNKRAETYYNMKLLDFFDKKKMSKYTYDYIINFALGPGLGLDKNTCSLGTFFHYFHLVMGSYTSFDKPWMVMKKPTSEAFINPLVNLLESKGVKFVYNAELILINNDNNNIKSCSVKINNNIETIISDDFVLAINPNYCYDIFNESKMLKLAEIHQNLQVNNKQISFRLGFIKKVNFSINNIGIVLADSKYNITFYPQENFFTVPIDLNYKLKSLWSGTCVQIYDNILTKEELINNIIIQILDCNELQNDIYKNSGFNLQKEDFIYSEIYDDWFWNNNLLQTKNKKWVNTFFNEEYKPSQKTEFTNLYLSGGHTKTSIRIWSMEAACESGKITANLILKKYKKNKSFIYNHIKPSYFTIFENLDDLLFINKLPNVIILFIIIIILFLFLNSNFS